MTVEAETVDDAETWNGLVERSSQTSPFHRYEALEVIADHSGTELYPFVGYKGEEPVGIFPVFEKRQWPVRAAFSPPPDLEVSYLGPAELDGASPKQRKAERRHRRFIEAVFEEVDEAISPNFTSVRTGVGYDDPRPFIWNDFDPTPRYTYLLDLTRDPEDLFMSFSSDVRRNVRKADEDLSYELEEGDAADVEQIIAQVQRRHEEQDVSYNVTPAFARDLYRAMPDGSVRAHVCRSEGEFVGGKITVEDDQTLLGWQTVSDLDSEVPATDLLDWEVIQRGAERDLQRFDLVGANNPRLCGYKAKFNPEVSTHYTLEWSTVATDAIKRLYLRMR